MEWEGKTRSGGNIYLKHLGDLEEIVIIGSVEETSVAKGYQFIRERQQKVGNN